MTWFASSPVVPVGLRAAAGTSGPLPAARRPHQLTDVHGREG